MMRAAGLLLSVVMMSTLATTDASASRDREELAEIAEKAGLWFVFLSDCPYCQRIWPNLEAVKAANGFAVLNISIDGPRMAVMEDADYVINKGQARILGTRTTPTIYLVTPDGTIASVAEGYVTRGVLESNILTTATILGLVE